MKLVLLILLASRLELSSQTMRDLSYPFVSGKVPTFSGNPTFRYTQTTVTTENGITLRRHTFETSEHIGTHLDAPSHYDPNGRSVEQIPLDQLYTKAVLINATEETGDNNNYALPKEKLLEWECTNGPFPNHSVVLVDFGWGRFYPDTDTYVGTGGGTQAPGLSKEAAEYIVETKKFCGVGVGTVSLDQGENRIVHKILLSNDLFGLENLNFSIPLPPIFDLQILPMNLVGGTGAPSRVIAVF